MLCKTTLLRKLFLAAATALSLLPAPAMAQSPSGKFTLVREVRWGNVVLRPGDYNYSVEHHSAETVLLRNMTNGTGAIVMAASISEIDSPKSQLVLERNGNDWFVRSLALSGTGEVLYFNPPTVRVDTGQVAGLGQQRGSAISNP